MQIVCLDGKCPYILSNVSSTIKIYFPFLCTFNLFIIIILHLSDMHVYVYIELSQQPHLFF